MLSYYALIPLLSVFDCIYVCPPIIVCLSLSLSLLPSLPLSQDILIAFISLILSSIGSTYAFLIGAFSCALTNNSRIKAD